MPFNTRRYKRNFAPKKAAGPFAKSKKPVSLQKQVDALKKVVKKDHTVIAKSLDYADFTTTTLYLNPLYQNFAIVSLIDPINWTETRRRSTATNTSVEALLKNFQLELGLRHNPLDTSGVTINWTLVCFSGKGDWYPTGSGSSLRKDIDYTMMGVGCPVMFNTDNIIVHKRWTCRTKTRSGGDDIVESTCFRSHKMGMNRKLKRTPVQSATTESNWKKLTAIDFNPMEQIYFGVYCDTCEGIPWSVAMPQVISVTAGFTVVTL